MRGIFGLVTETSLCFFVWLGLWRYARYSRLSYGDLSAGSRGRHQIPRPQHPRMPEGVAVGAGRRGTIARGTFLAYAHWENPKWRPSQSLVKGKFMSRPCQGKFLSRSLIIDIPSMIYNKTLSLFKINSSYIKLQYYQGKLRQNQIN